jgi:hypothetical protein
MVRIFIGGRRLAAHFGTSPAAGVVSARSLPAIGPESNSTVTRIVSESKPCGTRTEAVQKVPQANPDRAVASVRPPPSIRAIPAPGPSSLPGVVGAPR